MKGKIKLDSKKLLDLTVEAIDERHGEDTEAYDMQGISILADYYVVTTAGSNRQLRDSNWLLVDMGDVVVNVFTEDARDFYGLEKLWSNGKKLELNLD